MQKQSCNRFLKKGIIKNLAGFTRKQTSMPESYFWCALVNFAKLARKPFFAEQHGTTAPYYSSINSSEGSLI